MPSNGLHKCSRRGRPELRTPKNLKANLFHFKEDTDDDLHDHVEDEVADADVDAHVRQVPPDLPPTLGVVDQNGAIWHWAVPGYS